jgi:hypothetical protein
MYCLHLLLLAVVLAAGAYVIRRLCWEQSVSSQNKWKIDRTDCMIFAGIFGALALIGLVVMGSKSKEPVVFLSMDTGKYPGPSLQSDEGTLEKMVRHLVTPEAVNKSFKSNQGVAAQKDGGFFLMTPQQNMRGTDWATKNYKSFGDQLQLTS